MKNEHNTSVQIVDNQALDVNYPDPVAMVKLQDQIYSAMLKVAVQSTQPTDWLNMGDKLYLEAAGAERIARRLGVTVRPLGFEREDLHDDDGHYYMYTYTVEASHSKLGSMTAIGCCTSRDKFFGKNKSTSQVNVADIKRKACTNAEGNAIKRLLGIRALTWKELEALGVKKGGQATVAYKSKAQTPVQPSEELPPMEEKAAQEGVDKYHFCSFGKNKGMSWAEMAVDKVQWYINSILIPNVNDPEKARYQSENQKYLTAAMDAFISKGGDPSLIEGLE